MDDLDGKIKSTLDSLIRFNLEKIEVKAKKDTNDIYKLTRVYSDLINIAIYTGLFNESAINEYRKKYDDVAKLWTKNK